MKIYTTDFKHSVSNTTIVTSDLPFQITFREAHTNMSIMELTISRYKKSKQSKEKQQYTKHSINSYRLAVKNHSTNRDDLKLFGSRLFPKSGTRLVIHVIAIRQFWGHIWKKENNIVVTTVGTCLSSTVKQIFQRLIAS